MNVQELINMLESIEDKSRPVIMSIDDRFNNTVVRAIGQQQYVFLVNYGMEVDE